MQSGPGTLFNPVQLATPAFIGLVLLELVYARLAGRARYEARDTLTSLLMGLGSVIAGALAWGLLWSGAVMLLRRRATGRAWSVAVKVLTGALMLYFAIRSAVVLAGGF